MYDFSRRPPRKNKGSMKWDLMGDVNPNVKDEVVPLSVADMEFITAPEIREGLKEYIDQEILGYTQMWDGYRETIRNWCKNMHQWDIQPEWIVNTPGVVSAIYDAIEGFTKDTDSIILLSPVYYPFQLAIQNTNRKEVRVPLLEEEGYYRIDFKALEEAMKLEDTKMLIFCNPHNPVGRVWTKEELEKVHRLCKTYNIFLLSDEIWWDIILPGHKHISMGKILDDESRGMICTSASKTFNLAGLATSNIIIPNEKVREIYQMALEKSDRGGVSALGLVGTKVAFDKGEPWLKECLEVIDKNRKYMEDFFDQHLPQITYSPMEGTYLFWADFRSIEEDYKELEEFMTKKAELILDEGYIFGEEGKGWERFNLACPTEVLVETMERLLEALS
ncbi:MAG: MalY/PatB family protein [Tissierellia bacterium]|nr:MalY/PatB family protein [Tissierellia bacterium]